jgi:hypothetical protein
MASSSCHPLPKHHFPGGNKFVVLLCTSNYNRNPFSAEYNFFKIMYYMFCIKQKLNLIIQGSETAQ